MGPLSRSWARPAGSRPSVTRGRHRSSRGPPSASGSRRPVPRSLAHVAGKAWDLPHLVGSLCEGEISFDKVRVLADVATPESERRLCERAKGCTVRELADLARCEAEAVRASCGFRSGSGHDGRFLRFNDTYRTIGAQLPAASYAQTKAAVERSCATSLLTVRRLWTSVAATPSWGSSTRSGPLPEKGLEGPSGDGASPYVVVAHAPLDALVHDPGEESTLAGELEHARSIDAQTLRRIACDATVVIALDDGVGHTMYEGRARRFPSDPQRQRSSGGTDSVASRVVPTPPSATSTTSFRGNPVGGQIWTIRPSSASPRRGAPKGLDHDGRRQRRAHLRRPERPGHGVAPLAAVDQGDG